jgi:hypothetical protein
MKFALLVAETVVNVLLDTIPDEDASTSCCNHGEEPPLGLWRWSQNRLGLKSTLAVDPDVERHALPRGG